MADGLKKMKEKYLEKNGVDAEEFKYEHVGTNGGRFDIYQTDSGNRIYLISKDGRQKIDTLLSVNELFNQYGNSLGE